MNTYKIPVTYEMYGIVKIEASSLQQAIYYFQNNLDEIELPEDAYYVDGSFGLSTTDIEELERYQIEDV